MEHIGSSTKQEFDNLFAQLVGTLQEERELRTRAGTHVALIEVKDRLISLRSELAAARTQLTSAVRLTGEVTRPVSRRRSAHRSPDSSGRPGRMQAQLAATLDQRPAGPSPDPNPSRRP